MILCFCKQNPAQKSNLIVQHTKISKVNSEVVPNSIKTRENIVGKKRFLTLKFHQSLKKESVERWRSKYPTNIYDISYLVALEGKLQVEGRSANNTEVKKK